MALEVFEGTWEEIEQRKAEFIGRQLRLTVLPETSAISNETITATVREPIPLRPKTLTAYGAFKDVLPSSEDYMREKQADLDIEERKD